MLLSVLWRVILLTVTTTTPKPDTTMSNAYNTEAATVADFNAWEEAAKGCSTEQLLHIIRDCREAAKAMRTWNPIKEGYYEDQAWTFADEYRKRTRTQL